MYFLGFVPTYCMDVMPILMTVYPHKIKKNELDKDIGLEIKLEFEAKQPEVADVDGGNMRNNMFEGQGTSVKYMF